MGRVLVIGGGLAGCAAALELAGNGMQVTVIEKSPGIGGKVRQYGCKATNMCNNCGLCIVGDLWESVEKHDAIEIMTGTQVVDVLGQKGAYRAVVKDSTGVRVIPGIQSIIVSIGFNEFSSLSTGSLEFSPEGGIITGYQLEKILASRTGDGIPVGNPSSIAFIQCFGSRDIQEKAGYCSKVCCGYSTRAARVLRQYFPDSDITFFYMDLQMVDPGQYFETLQSENIRFVRSRPVKIRQGKSAKVVYEDYDTGEVVEKEFDLIVLSEGIHPPESADRLAEVCTLSIDDNGFLKELKGGNPGGIYVIGCASGPKGIKEVYAESLSAAREIACG